MPHKQLTHWGRDKMAAIFQTTFSNAFFFSENVWISLKISLRFVPNGPINIPSIGSDNGLAPARRQAIIWTKGGWFADAIMRHSASMS